MDLTVCRASTCWMQENNTEARLVLLITSKLEEAQSQPSDRAGPISISVKMTTSLWASESRTAWPSSRRRPTPPPCSTATPTRSSTMCRRRRSYPLPARASASCASPPTTPFLRGMCPGCWCLTCAAPFRRSNAVRCCAAMLSICPSPSALSSGWAQPPRQLPVAWVCAGPAPQH